MYVAWLTFPDMYHWADRKIYNWKYGSSCRRADMVLAISESTKRDVIRFYGVKEEKVKVIYQPVQEYYYTPLPEETCDKLIAEHFGKQGLPPFILYVGSINSRKNLLGALQALAMIPKENRPLLLIIGNGREYRKECEAFIAKNSHPSFYEGFGLPVVEAALQQTPVITTTVSSLPEAAGPDACLIDPHASDAAEQMARHIDSLCGDRALAKSIHRAKDGGLCKANVHSRDD